MSAAFQQRMQAAAQRERNTETPEASGSRKRRRTEGSTSAPQSEDEDDVSPTPLGVSTGGSGPATRNAAISVKNFAKKQKLRGEQLTQLDTFLNDTQTVREGKLFSLLLGLQNDVGNIIVAAPPFSVSPELKAYFPTSFCTNIQSYALAVLLSPKLAQYRGDLSVQHVMQILLKHRYDLPPGIENNPADMHKVTTAIQDAFTQCRSSIKKKLFASVRISRLNEENKRIIIDLEPSKHQNLFALAQALVDGTKCRITNALCGRIALMREVYLRDSSTKYWTELDNSLATMRKIANGNDDARDAMFEDLIVTDKELHGAVEITYQPTNEVQQEVDELIDAASANLASTPTPASATTPEPEVPSTQGDGQ
ncbi:hypothetical protein B0H11DRAFT_2426842 [Mycena galericulata]|nr:hypothetical protein B0H11DRAFT_2426842 [Mycena galericulata]